ncbi:adhesion G-protein coupled receptor G7-like [Strongylocentrotus purpuratus]|uniref:Uncharacterized protein n=1 Tax=Strongylocentrotus purpuratus TaxID=7668 RepID=A0A7M7NYH2_STRPU|nr:adhesion G-protein coupled receptor G7-like [Strongylocentrotus purpuratus]
MAMFTVLPIKHMGKEYFIATLTEPRGGVVLLSAINEPTELKIELTGRVEFRGEWHSPGSVIICSLRPYETLKLKLLHDDIIGTRITANTSIAVTIGGNCPNVPDGANFCDHIAEQLVSFDRWGRSFLLSPFANRLSGYQFQVVAGRNDTKVSLGNYEIDLNMGEHYLGDIANQSMTSISATKPVMVMQYSKGGTTDQSGGDPAMLLVTPWEQYVSRVEFPVLNFSAAGISTVHIGVISECNATHNIEFDNYKYNEVPWLFEYDLVTSDNRVICSRWVTIEEGSHELKSESATQVTCAEETLFTALVYGVGISVRIAYLYNAGFGLQPQTCIAPSPDPPYKEIEVSCASQRRINCSGSDPCQNGGTWENNACQCAAGFDGVSCSTAICQNISWISPRFEKVEFPVGENGTWANSTGMCPFNTTQANEPIGRALCFGDGITQSQWYPVDNCGPFRNVTDILTEIAQVIVSEENAGEVSQQVAYITSNIEDITSDDIMFVAEITSNIVKQNLTSEEVTKSITSIVSNIAQVETEELEAAEEEGGAISKFVQAFEEQINHVQVADGGMLNIQQPNVAVQAQSVLADDVMSGLVISLAGYSLSDLTKSNITIGAPTQDDRYDIIATRPDIIAQVNIPPSVSSVISSAVPLSGSPSNGSVEYVRVNFNVFSSPALFISKSLRTISADNEGFNRSANSLVISLSIGQGKVAALTEFINFTFTTIMSGYVNPNCSFWDEEQKDWSQDGCVLVSGITSSDERYDEERVRCACDHLTNFAVIVDIHRPEDSPIEAYNILTYIGCCISIFSLLVTLTTYLWNKDLRTKQTNQIFIYLCLTLLCLYTTFIIMISLDSIRDYREVHAGPCGFLTALVHYFVLSSIAWMGVEGYNIYLTIVKIFNTYIQNFMLKAFLAAWGIPALIVVLTGAIARESYARDDLCFLQFWAQIGGLLIPMSIILLINIVIFILVVRQLLRSANITGRVKREAKEKRQETIERVQNAICILLLLGLTWVTGYLLLIPSFSQVAQPIFIVLNSFQGLFIFLLYCVRKPHIRKKWGLTCFDKFLKKEASTSSGGVSSTVPSSSPGILRKLRPGATGNFVLPTKDDNPDPMCMFNPTFDVSQVEEGVTPPMNKDIQSSTKELKKDTDRDATSTDVVLDASVTNVTKGGDGVSSTRDADTVSVTLDSTDATKATEGTGDVASTNNDAATSIL